MKESTSTKMADSETAALLEMSPTTGIPQVYLKLKTILRKILEWLLPNI